MRDCPLHIKAEVVFQKLVSGSLLYNGTFFVYKLWGNQMIPGGLVSRILKDRYLPSNFFVEWLSLVLSPEEKNDLITAIQPGGLLIPVFTKKDECSFYPYNNQLNLEAKAYLDDSVSFYHPQNFGVLELDFSAN